MGFADLAKQRVLFKVAYLQEQPLYLLFLRGTSSLFSEGPFLLFHVLFQPKSCRQSFPLTSLRVFPKPCWYAFHSLGCCQIGVCSLVPAPLITSSPCSGLNDASPGFHSLSAHLPLASQTWVGTETDFCQQSMTRQQVQGLLDT